MANEIDIDIGTFDLNTTNGINISDIDVRIGKAIKSSDLPKTHGAVIPIGKRKEISISVRGGVLGSDHDDLRSKLDALKAALESSSEQKLTTDDDRYLMVQYRGFSYSYQPLRRFAAFSFDVVASDPFWYAESKTTVTKTEGVDLTNAVAFTVNNPGNAPTRVKITFTNNDTGSGSTISDDIKVENLTAGEEFQYRGDLASTKDLEVDNRVIADDLEVENDGADDIANFEGDFITLNSGDNSIRITSASPGYGIQIEYYAAYL